MRCNGQDVVAAARRWIGTPFHHMGRNRYGLDCAGLIVVVAAECGLLSEVRLPRYGRVPRPHLLVPTMQRYLRQVPESEVAPGDVLLFRVRQHPQHVAIYSERAGEPHFVHAYEPIGRTDETRFDARWEAALLSVWKWPELEEN